MTIIKDTLSDIGGGVGQGWVEFMCATIRDSADHTRTVTTRPVRVQINSSGAFTTPNLDPGPAIVTVRVGDDFRREWPIVIPNSSTEVRLYDLLDQYTELPPPVVSQAWAAAQAAIQARNEVDDFRAYIVEQIMPQIGGYQEAAEQSAISAAASAQQSADMIPPATATQLGKVKLRGDLGGTAEDPKVPALAQKANLGSDGKLLQAEMPAQQMVDFLGNVASQSAMLALVGQRGDWCNRTDLGTEWQLIAEPSTSLSSWAQKIYPASPVSSVHGRQGAITTSTADITDMSTLGQTLAKSSSPANARSSIGATNGAMKDSGNWTAGITYTVDSVVTYQYGRWHCKTDHTAAATFDSSKWIFLGLDAVVSTTDPGGGRLWVKI